MINAEFFNTTYRGPGLADWELRQTRMKRRERQIIAATDAAYEAEDYEKAGRLEDAQLRLCRAMP